MIQNFSALIWKKNKKERKKEKDQKILDSNVQEVGKAL